MIKQTVTLDEAIEYLNELIKLDRVAMAALVANRVPCNQGLADHPTAQVCAQHGGYLVGMLGILNGLFGTLKDRRGPIVFIFKDSNLLAIDKTEDLECST